jgi:hypothetical protein
MPGLPTPSVPVTAITAANAAVITKSFYATFSDRKHREVCANIVEAARKGNDDIVVTFWDKDGAHDPVLDQLKAVGFDVWPLQSDGNTYTEYVVSWKAQNE